MHFTCAGNQDELWQASAFTEINQIVLLLLTKEKAVTEGVCRVDLHCPVLQSDSREQFVSVALTFSYLGKKLQTLLMFQISLVVWLKFPFWSLNKLQWITLWKNKTALISSIFLWYKWNVWWEHDPTSVPLEDSPTAWDSSSAQSLALHVRAISTRAWQLVLQMKLTRVYSASLMACFSPLPKEQASSLKGTCCLLIFNLLQAYAGILPLSSGASPGPPACSATSTAEEMIPISGKSGHDLPMCCTWASQASSTPSPWCALSLLASDLLSVEHWAGFWGAALQVAAPGKGPCWWETADQFLCYPPSWTRYHRDGGL